MIPPLGQSLGVLESKEVALNVDGDKNGKVSISDLFEFHLFVPPTLSLSLSLSLSLYAAIIFFDNHFL